MVRAGIAASIPLYRSGCEFQSLATNEERVIRVHLDDCSYREGELVHVPRDGTTFLHEAKVIAMNKSVQGVEVDEPLVYVEYTTLK